MIFKQLGEQPYKNTWENMKTFTDARDENTENEVWLLEHPPVFTQGQAGKAEHILNPKHIPVVQSDRGGQVTYHGPGQLIGYCLFDLKQLNIGIKSLVCQLEDVLITTLAEFNITALRKKGAPGVYVNDAKIASLGLRVRKACTYHGLSLNVNMDLTPFQWINPCGFKDMPVTQIKHFVPDIQMRDVVNVLEKTFRKIF